jgi:hypothetical protein
LVAENTLTLTFFAPPIADRDDLSVLKHAQQRRLHRKRHLANLVEKDDPAGKRRERNPLITIGAVNAPRR